MKKRRVGFRDVVALSQALDTAITELSEAEEKLFGTLRSYGIDLGSPQYDPKPKKPRKRRTQASVRKKGARGGESLRVLKIRGRAINAVIQAGFPTFEKLNGASKKKLLSMRGVGRGVVTTLEGALKKRKMGLKP